MRTASGMQVMCQLGWDEVLDVYHRTLTWSSGGPGDEETRGGVCLKSSGALEMHCRRRDIEYGALEFWRRAAGVGGVEEVASRGPEMRRRRVDVVWTYRGLEVRCRRSDIEVWRSGALEMRCWRCLKRCMELGRCAAGV